ncbi:MAG: glycosyltransferase family 2 protein [Candidatus Velthaea sp.]
MSVGMPILWLLVAVQAALALRVLWRMVRSARGTHLQTAAAPVEPGSIAVVVPVLNEEARLGPCLEGLIASGPAVREILVVDGGSTDATAALIARFAARDARIRLVDAAPVPADWNGKAWGLDRGLHASSPDVTWIATIDADVRPKGELVARMAAHAKATGLPALSIATRQELGDAGEGLLHPAMLTTLVYRYGLPGHAAARVEDVQANGQCFIARRDVLRTTDAFGAARASLCEDVTAARVIVRAGHRVGFYEAGDLVVVRMHANWQETWTNWPRSLTLRDDVAPRLAALGLAEIALVQAAPLPLLLAALASQGGTTAAHILFPIETVLLMIRLGVLAGTYRAYRNPPWTYWLSPLADVPVALALIVSALRRRHTWRGRTLVISGRTT